MNEKLSFIAFCWSISIYYIGKGFSVVYLSLCSGPLLLSHPNMIIEVKLRFLKHLENLMVASWRGVR